MLFAEEGESRKATSLHESGEVGSPSGASGVRGASSAKSASLTSSSPLLSRAPVTPELQLPIVAPWARLSTHSAPSDWPPKFLISLPSALGHYSKKKPRGGISLMYSLRTATWDELRLCYTHAWIACLGRTVDAMVRWLVFWWYFGRAPFYVAHDTSRALMLFV